MSSRRSRHAVGLNRMITGLRRGKSMAAQSLLRVPDPSCEEQLQFAPGGKPQERCIRVDCVQPDNRFTALPRSAPASRRISHAGVPRTVCRHMQLQYLLRQQQLVTEVTPCGAAEDSAHMSSATAMVSDVQSKQLALETVGIYSSRVSSDTGIDAVILQ